ncbi:hypothetical protein KEM56_000692, partial [Ascosphaera pollenicola]
HVLIPISSNPARRLRSGKHVKQETEDKATHLIDIVKPQTPHSEDEEDNTEMPELSEFEKERLANIKERDELLKKLRQEALSAGLFPSSISSSPAERQRKAASSHKRVKREHTESPRPTRSSARLRGLQASSEAEKRKYEEEQEAVHREEQKKRMRVPGDLKLEDIIVGGTRWNNELRGLGIGAASDAKKWESFKEEEEESKPPKEISKEVAEAKARFEGLKIWDQWESTRIKITPERIYTMAFHPTEEKPIVFAGDKIGHLGILDASQTSTSVKREDDDENGDDDPDPMITTFKPHSRTISSIFVHRSQPTKLYTSSYDSSIRILDLENQTATEAYAPSDLNDEDPLSGVELHPTDTNTVYFTSLEGNFGYHDTRTRNRQGAQIYPLSDKKIGGFTLCPAAPNYFATASLDRSMRVWDLRNLKKEASVPVGEHISALSVSHAAFNSAGQIATASYDNTIKIHDLASAGILSGWPKSHTLSESEMEPSTTIRHNCQTGRWVTILRPQWQQTPAVNPTVQRFAIGNMNR